MSLTERFSWSRVVFGLAGYSRSLVIARSYSARLVLADTLTLRIMSTDSAFDIRLTQSRCFNFHQLLGFCFT